MPQVQNKLEKATIIRNVKIPLDYQILNGDDGVAHVKAAYMRLHTHAPIYDLIISKECIKNATTDKIDIVWHHGDDVASITAGLPGLHIYIVKPNTLLGIVCRT
jgi:hypothetical protein